MLTQAHYKKAAKALGVRIAVVKAIAEVESSGSGFAADGLPKILFEAHKFHEYTKGKYTKDYPSISSKLRNPDLYEGGSAEWKRYRLAKSLDENAARRSTSWSAFQIMGNNFREAGYSDIETFVKAMTSSEEAGLMAFVHFVKHKKLDVHLRNEDYHAFFEGYNGKAYKKMKYDVKFFAALKKHDKDGDA